MTKELLISSTPFGKRSAMIENGKVSTLNVEHDSEPNFIGNIYKASFARKTNGPQFINIGDNQKAFINSLRCKSEEKLIVQIVRNSMDSKAIKVTDSPVLIGHYVIATPYSAKIRISPKITDPIKQKQLHTLGKKLCDNKFGGFKLRSSTVNASEIVIRQELQNLYNKWSELQLKAKSVTAPLLLARGPTFIERLIYTVNLETINNIFVDDKNTYFELEQVISNTAPVFLTKLQYVNEMLFDRYDVATVLSDSLLPKIALHGGGQIIVEHTQALSVIDVDTGIRKGNYKSTLLVACINATETIANAIRQRNITGLIIIDFPRLQTSDENKSLVKEMQRQMSNDPIPHKILGISDSGLMEISRQRIEAPVLENMTELVSYETYQGRKPRLSSIAFDVIDTARNKVRNGMRRGAINASPELVQYINEFTIKTESNRTVNINEWLGAEVCWKSQMKYARDQWDIESLQG